MSERARTVEPTALAHRAIEWLGVLSSATALGFRPWCKVDVVGAEAIPREGPLLFLCNHAGIFDPLALMLAVRRPVHMLATDSVWTEPALAWLMQVTGAVPKRKFVPDARAIRRLQRWADLGASVGLFPEGERSWDGRPLPLVPGIDKLVRLLDIPVVTARVVGNHLLWPRWAERVRRGSVRVELDPPRRFSRDTPLAEIERIVAEAIRVPTGQGPPGPIRGHNLAHGLPNLLFACPGCGTLDALRATGDLIRCETCRAAWRIDLEQVLHPEHGGPAVSLADMVDRIHARMEDVSGEVLLESATSRLFEINASGLEPRGEGALVLTPRTIELRSDRRSTWTLELRDLVLTTIDLRRRLQFRTRTQVFELQIDHGSVRKWEILTQIQRRRIETAERAHARRSFVQ